MATSKQKSPDNLLKNSQILLTTNKYNNRSYLPSRYAQDQKIEKVGFTNILNTIQDKINNQAKNNTRENSPKIMHVGTIVKNQINVKEVNEKRLKTSQFRSRPLKREKSDQLKFNQIFLNPRQQALEQLKKKSGVQDNIKTISKQYEKLLKFSTNSQQPLNQNQKINQQKPSQDFISKQNYQQAIQLLQSGDGFGLNIQSNTIDFYDNHILVQPPDVPTSTHQNSSPGTSYAPSIPSNYKSYKNLNTKQLLMRVRTGLSNQDVQKQAHLSYFLGQIYADKKIYEEALKFHKRYLGFAKIMQDIIGMSVGTNRVAIDYYNCQQIQKSIIFHNENLKISNNDNCFVGFYNIGICYRKLGKLHQAMQYFLSALAWSQQKGQQQSECIVLGQIAITHQQLQQYTQAINKFQKSNQICQRIKKYDLKLNNLRHIIRISSILQQKPLQKIKKILEQAFYESKQSCAINMIDIFRSNIGIVKGMEEIQRDLDIHMEVCQIQEI